MGKNPTPIRIIVPQQWDGLDIVYFEARGDSFIVDVLQRHGIINSYTVSKQARLFFDRVNAPIRPVAVVYPVMIDVPFEFDGFGAIRFEWGRVAVVFHCSVCGVNDCHSPAEFWSECRFCEERKRLMFIATREFKENRFIVNQMQKQLTHLNKNRSRHARKEYKKARERIKRNQDYRGSTVILD